MKFIKLVLLLGLLFSHVVYADTVKLKNGDWLTGKVIKKETDKLVFKTKYAGEIEIIWTEIATLKTEEKVKVVLSDDTSVNAKIKNQSLGYVKLVGSGLQMTTALNMNDVSYINPSAQLTGEGVDWTGHINLGGALTQGNTDTTVLRLDGDATARTKKDRLAMTGYVNHAKSNNVDTQKNSKGNLQYDRFLTKKWFIYANTSLENDEFRDISLRSTLGLGSGYQVFEGKDRNLSIEGGLNYISTNFNKAKDQAYTSVRWRLKYDQLIYQRVKFFHQHEILMGIKDVENVLAFTKTGLRVPIAERLNASTQLNLEYAGRPAAGRKRADKTLLFSLGYEW